MRVIPFLLLMMALTSPGLQAEQPDFRLYGSVGSETRVTSGDPNSPLNPGNFLNVERRTNISDFTLFGELVPDSKSWKLHFKLKGSGEFRRDSTGRLEVSELYWNVSVTPWLDVTAGRKIEKWGTGYGWNPTGVINPAKDPSDPNDRRDSFRGVDMVGIDMLVGGWNISALAVPEINWDRAEGKFFRSAGWAARAYRLVKGTDLSFSASGGNGLPNSQGISLSRVFGNALELHAEAARIGDGVRSVPAEGEFKPKSRPYVSVVVGGQYTFPKNINLVFEYFHTGSGLSSQEWSEFRQTVRSGQTDLAENHPDRLLQANGHFSPLLMGRNYSFVRALWPIRLNKLEAELIVISSLRDGSTLVRPGISWRFHPNWSLYFIQNEFIGSPRTEFGHVQVKRSSEFGFRYHFSFEKSRQR